MNLISAGFGGVEAETVLGEGGGQVGRLWGSWSTWTSGEHKVWEWEG